MNLQDRIIGFEHSVVGKPGARWAKDQSTNLNISYFSIVIALAVSTLSFLDNLETEGFSLKVIIYTILVSFPNKFPRFY